MLLKQTNNVRLNIESTPLDSPDNMNHLVFSREFLDDDGVEVINISNFEMFLTTEEIQKLKDLL
jgi:hypothetical protein